MDNVDEIFKFIVLGCHNVGKTSLLTRMVDNVFHEKLKLTIGCDFKLKQFELDHQQIQVQLWDTQGVERFHAIVSQKYMMGADGVFLVYDVTDEESFSEFEKTFQQYATHIHKGTPLILVGTKTDLIADRKISQDIGRALAVDLGAAYIETSALANSNCIEALEQLTRLAIMNSKNKLFQQQQYQQQQLEYVKKDVTDHR